MKIGKLEIKFNRKPSWKQRIERLEIAVETLTQIVNRLVK